MFIFKSSRNCFSKTCKPDFFFFFWIVKCHKRFSHNLHFILVGRATTGASLLPEAEAAANQGPLLFLARTSHETRSIREPAEQTARRVTGPPPRKNSPRLVWHRPSIRREPFVRTRSAVRSATSQRVDVHPSLVCGESKSRSGFICRAFMFFFLKRT